MPECTPGCWRLTPRPSGEKCKLFPPRCMCVYFLRVAKLKVLYRWYTTHGRIGHCRQNGMPFTGLLLQHSTTYCRVMQGWLFQSSFWKNPQAEALLTSVPIVSTRFQLLLIRTEFIKAKCCQTLLSSNRSYLVWANSSFPNTLWKSFLWSKLMVVL